MTIKNRLQTLETSLLEELKPKTLGLTLRRDYLFLEHAVEGLLGAKTKGF